MKPEPLISIITVNYNNAIGLAATLKSTVEQEYKAVETILIDGNSNDEIEKVLHDFRDRLDVVIKEEDHGIYDAMNKGVKRAKGDWIIFMNSGDSFYHSKVLSSVVSQGMNDVDFIFGDVSVNYKFGFSRIQESRNIQSIWRNLPFSHQSLFSKTALLQQHPFDLNYPICADYEFCAYWKSKGAMFKKVNLIIATIEAGGKSELNRFQTALQVKNISTQYFPNIFHSIYLWFYCIKELVFEFAKSLLPSRIVGFLTPIKYQ